MTERYFEKFPIITYANTQVVDISRRTAIVTDVFKSAFNYYQYSIANSERPDNISDRYYNDPYMSWLIYLSNSITDPYYDWHLDQTTFDDFIALKYGSYTKALSKVAFFRNNWYQNPDQYTVSYYAGLDASLKKYYEPVTPNDFYSTTPMAYRRVRQDTQITTNAIVNYSVANGSFTHDEIVNVVFDSNYTGIGQVCFANSSSISIQHVFGYTTGTISPSSYIYGTESGVNTAFTTSAVLVNNIPSPEVGYWSPVYYYDLETEKNQYNQSIAVINAAYASSAATQLNNLLNQ